MANPEPSQIREQLRDRRDKLEQAISRAPSDAHLQELLGEVDAALERVADGTYGLCETCHEPIEPERLTADPLVRFCLDHLTPSQQRALEEDLEIASQIQSVLLPQRGIESNGWRVAYHYEGAGPVSGDYCDLLSAGEEDLYFAIGDVSGKGVAASLLMAHLHATFRALVSLDLPLESVMERASRTFCENTLPTYFATLVFGRAHPTGDVEVCNAGHLPPLVVRGDGVSPIEATGLPLGMFCDEKFSVSQVRLSPGESLVLYTDGLSEAQNGFGEEYGVERLSRFLSERHALEPDALVSACIGDLKAFQSGAPKRDDLTLMAIRKLDHTALR